MDEKNIDRNLALKPVRKVKDGKKYVQFYEFSDPRILPPKRALAALTLTRFANLRITWDSLSAILDAATEAFNSGQYTRAAAMMEEIRVREKLFTEEETLKELATVYFLMEDEPLTEFSRVHNAKKIELWEQDEDSRAFFLSEAWKFTDNFSDHSGTNLAAYLREGAAVVKRIARFKRTRNPSN